jgi:hypothetical protein
MIRVPRRDTRLGELAPNTRLRGRAEVLVLVGADQPGLLDDAVVDALE